MAACLHEHQERTLPRYAVYYAPSRGSHLEQWGEYWLGRTATAPALLREIPPDGFTEVEYRECVRQPRHYGFHGTLHAPFELAPEVAPRHMVEHVRIVCAEHAPFVIAKLTVRQMGMFLALTPMLATPALGRLSADLVYGLDSLRAPLSTEDFARYMQKGISEPQERLLRRFGYPFVLKEFRFHMTLTGPLADSERQTCKQRIKALAAAYLEHPVAVDDVAVYLQPDRQSPFVEYARIPLGNNAGAV